MIHSRHHRAGNYGGFYCLYSYIDPNPCLVFDGEIDVWVTSSLRLTWCNGKSVSTLNNFQFTAHQQRSQKDSKPERNSEGGRQDSSIQYWCFSCTFEMMCFIIWQLREILRQTWKVLTSYENNVGGCGVFHLQAKASMKVLVTILFLMLWCKC